MSEADCINAEESAIRLSMAKEGYEVIVSIPERIEAIGREDYLMRDYYVNCGSLPIMSIRICACKIDDKVVIIYVNGDSSCQMMSICNHFDSIK